MKKKCIFFFKNICADYVLAFYDAVVPSMTPTTGGSLLEATAAKCSPYASFSAQKMLKNTKNAFFFAKYLCGLRPRILRRSCTFDDTSHRWVPPRSYGRKMQPMTPIFPKKCTFFEKNCIFFLKYLVMCIFCCTFALAFEKEVGHTVTVLSSSGLGQRPLTP